MPLSCTRLKGGMSQARSPCTWCMSAPWMSGRLCSPAYMPRRFMRASCSSVTWSRCENAQRSPLIGSTLLTASYSSRYASIAFSISTWALRNMPLGNRVRDAAHFAHVFGPDHEVVPQQIRGRGRINRFAPADVLEIVAALERRVLLDFAEHLVHLLRRRGLADGGP